MWFVFFYGSSQATARDSASSFLLGEHLQHPRFLALLGSHITSYD
jgi:hypothetical protein